MSSQDSQGVPGIPPNIPLLIGPQLLGVFFNWGLFGALCVQVYIYYLCFPRDSGYKKSLVYILFLAEIAQTCMATNDAFHWLVYGWGRPDLLGEEALSWFDVPIMTGIISSTVQLSFAWRIWSLSRSLLLAGTIATLSLVQGSAAMATGIQSSFGTTFAEVTAKLFPSTSVWLAGSALVDILIAVSMTYLLTRSRNGFRTTDYLIARLVRLAVETGTVTATVATVDVILFNAFKNSNLFICPSTALAKLYTNSLMVVFNNRIFLQAAKPLVNTSGTRSIEPEPVDFYQARIRDALSPGLGGPRASSGTFLAASLKERARDAEANNDNDIPLHPIPARDAGSTKGGSIKYTSKW